MPADRLKELSYAAFLDPIELFDELNHIKPLHQMPEQVRRAIASFEVDPISRVTKIKFVDKLGAIMDYSKLARDIPKESEPTAVRLEMAKAAAPYCHPKLAAVEHTGPGEGGTMIREHRIQFV